jgi:anti-anti-sigma regulatory factor
MLRLAGELEIGSAVELKAQLLEALALGQPIQLELEAVTAVDLTGLQLLTGAERAARVRGVRWVRSGTSPQALQRVADEAGWERVPFAEEAQ